MIQSTEQDVRHIRNDKTVGEGKPQYQTALDARASGDYPQIPTIEVFAAQRTDDKRTDGTEQCKRCRRGAIIQIVLVRFDLLPHELYITFHLCTVRDKFTK